MKNLIVFLALGLIGQFTYTQNSTWIAALDVGIQQQDRRSFNLSGQMEPLETSTNFPGTYQIGYSVAKRWVNDQGLVSQVGAGLHVETATFKRPFNHGFRQDIADHRLRYVDNYHNFLIPVELAMGYALERVVLQLSVVNNLNVLSVVDAGNEYYAWGRSTLSSTELYTNALLRLTARTRISVGYRAFQYKRIDPIIFYGIVPDAGNKRYETYNPFRLRWSLQYDLGSRR